MKQNYYNQGVEYCSKQLDRSYASIVKKCSTLGIITKINGNQAWKKQEIEFLEKTYEAKGPSYCAKILKRTLKSVEQKAFILKLRCKKTIISDEWLSKNITKGYHFCAKQLNCSEDVIYNTLKRLDLLKKINPWTNDDIIFLMNNYLTLGPKGCQLKLKRPFRSIYRKAYQLGLKKEREPRYIIGMMHKSFWTRVKYGAKKRTLIINITPPDIWQLFLDQDKKCLFCNDTISLDLPITASLDRIDNKIGYILSNVQLLCIPCNMVKGHVFKTDAEFLTHIIKIANHQKVLI